MPKTTDQNLIWNAVQAAVQSAAQDCIADAVKQFEADLARKVQSIGLDLFREVSIHQMRDDIVITLKNKMKD